jgi:Mrp family chromosome partitioning ATPase
MSDVARLSPWHEEVQRIRLATFGRGIRLAGFTSPRAKSGVSSLCTALASVTAASGLRTLLVDLSEAPGEAENAVPWLPGSGGALVAIPPGGSSPYDKLTARLTPGNRDLFNNSAQLRRTLMDELAEYAAVIVDLAPLKPRFPGAIDATSAAAACGNVYLVCLTGEVTKTEVSDGVARLHSAGVEVLGFILNDAANPTLGAELAREVLRFKRLAPQFTASLASKLLASPFLN